MILNLNFTDIRDRFTLKRGTVPAGTDTSAEGYVDPTYSPNITDRDFNTNIDKSGTFTFTSPDE